MRYARWLVEGEARSVEVTEEGGWELDAPPWNGGRRTGRRWASPPDEAWLAPTQPTKVLGIGRNYRAHAQELGNEVPSEPLVFLKPPSSVVGPGARVALPPESRRVDFEGEVGVVIGRRVRRPTREEARAAIFGVVPLCDVTARDLQKKEGQWARAKGFDGFCPLGPEVVTGLDVGALTVVTRVNGAERQRGATQDLIFDVETCIAWIAAAMTLEPGDVVATGTPEGVGPLAPGDAVEVLIEGVAPLRFSVE